MELTRNRNGRSRTATRRRHFASAIVSLSFKITLPLEWCRLTIRSDQKIKDLETKLDNVSGELQQTKSENAHLRTEKEQLEYEIQRLKDENYRMQASQNSPGQWGPY